MSIDPRYAAPAAARANAARLNEIIAKASAADAREAARLYDAETNDRAVRAMEGASRDFYACGDRGDDYDDADFD